MPSDDSIYDSLYEEARQNGWQGWGGDARISTGPSQVAGILEKTYVPKSGRVLDMGCGEGHLCRLFAGHGYCVTGIDISGKAIAWALEKDSGQNCITYVQGNLCQSEVLAGDSFDLIVDGNCLHCILGDDRPLLLRNIQRLLSDNGIFFVSSLCSKDGQSGILSYKGQPYRYVSSVDNLLLELECAQFRVLEWTVREREVHNHISVFAEKQSLNFRQSISLISS